MQPRRSARTPQLLISNVDHSLFFKIDGDFTIMVLIYVDDIIIISNNVEEIRKIKLQLRKKIDINDQNLKRNQ
jgi:Reverse transcriptase (RNA-dependent DNA polymerase)